MRVVQGLFWLSAGVVLLAAVLHVAVVVGGGAPAVHPQTAAVAVVGGVVVACQGPLLITRKLGPAAQPGSVAGGAAVAPNPPCGVLETSFWGALRPTATTSVDSAGGDLRRTERAAFRDKVL